jgi:hypothetical protein
MVKSGHQSAAIRHLWINLESQLGFDNSGIMSAEFFQYLLVLQFLWHTLQIY